MTETSSSIFSEGTTPTNANDPSSGSDMVLKAAARVLMPDRSQVVLRASSLESLLPPGQRARMVWGDVDRQNMSRLYAGIKAVEGGPGRPAMAPEFLFALWLFATLEGMGRARRLEQLAGEDDAYRWIFGGVDVNDPTLADFRHEVEAMDERLTDSIASLMAAGAVKLKAVAQDGMRVRASAGAASFRREDKLKEPLETARKRVAQLKAHVDDPVGESPRKQAAQRRAAEEREARIEESESDGAAVCLGTSPDVHVAAGARVDHHRNRHARNSRNDSLTAENAGKSTNVRSEAGRMMLFRYSFPWWGESSRPTTTGAKIQKFTASECPGHRLASEKAHGCFQGRSPLL